MRGLRRRVTRGRALWGTLGTYLLWRLTRGAAYVIDHANAQRTLLFDIETLSWDSGLFEVFGLEPLLDAPALPALIPTTPRAPIRSSAPWPECSVAALSGDQQAALIGLGCRAEGLFSINYGSGAFVLASTGREPVRVPGLLTTLLASWWDERGGTPRLEARYALEGPVNSAATAIDWALDRLGLRVRTRELDDYLGAEPEGRRGVFFLPAVAGVGAPRWDPAARPKFSGDVRGATPRDLLRAVLESIACRCAEIIRLAQSPATTSNGIGVASAGPDTGPVLAAGGLTRCRTLLQAQADLLQRPVVVRESPDATCRGAALLARNPSLWWGRDRDLSGSTVVEPRLSRGEAETRYRAWERAVYGAEAPSARGVTAAPASR